MKTTYLILLVFTTVCVQCTAQKYFQNSSDKFLKWILENEKVLNVSKTPLKVDFGTFNRVSNKITLSKKDSVNIQKQILENNKSSIDSTISPLKHFMEWAELRESMKRGTYLFLKVSKPIFFQDKVLIVVEEYCGIECGSGEIQVYQIKDSKYTLLFKEMTWIS